MPMSKLERAIAALNECADSLDALPSALRRRQPLFGLYFVNTQTLREEASWIEAVEQSVRSSNEETSDADGEG